MKAAPRVEATEARYRLTAALLQAGQPLTLADLAAQTSLSAADLEPALEALGRERLVVSGRLEPGSDAVQYGWAARWERALRAAAAGDRRALAAAVGLPAPGPRRPDLWGEAARAFCAYVLDQYRPPADKAVLVFLQCSVRRPFSSSPSHASMRRAIAAATGFDPAGDFERCPVHVVVVASHVGPVPYELEGAYPANVRANGVKQMRPEEYARAGPELAGRLGAYLRVHGPRYRHLTSFAEGRYAEVLARAADAAGAPFAPLPRAGGPEVVRVGRSRPRKYWERYWIQLYLQLCEWLDEPQRRAARQRLESLDVEWVSGAAAH